MHLHALWPKSKSSPSDASQVLFDYSRFFCAVDGMDFFFCNPLCPACNVDFGFGAMMGSTLLGWVPSMYQRVRRVGLSVVRGPPSTSNNQPLMLVDRRFFHSDVVAWDYLSMVACQSWIVLLESCLLTFVSAANATIGSLQNQGRPCLSLGQLSFLPDFANNFCFSAKEGPELCLAWSVGQSLSTSYHNHTVEKSGVGQCHNLAVHLGRVHTYMKKRHLLFSIFVGT